MVVTSIQEAVSIGAEALGTDAPDGLKPLQLGSFWNSWLFLSDEEVIRALEAYDEAKSNGLRTTTKDERSEP